MTQKEYQKLVSEFKALMATGEKDQRKLAQLAYLAIDGMGHSPAEFASDTGYTVETVRRYRKVHQWTLDNPTREESFTDVMVLVGMSTERAEAVQVLSDITGKAIATVKSDTEAIAKVRTFLADNQELVTEALKDDDTRQGVVTAAFQAASEDMGATQRQGARDKAKAAHKPKPTLRAEAITQLKYKAINSGIWGRANLPMITEQLELLGPYLDQPTIGKMIEDLRPAYEAMLVTWDTLGALQTASVQK